MINKLKEILKTYVAITEQMADPKIISNIAEYSKLAKEHRQLSTTADLAQEYIKIYNHIKEDEEILHGEDIELKELVKDEIPEL